MWTCVIADRALYHDPDEIRSTSFTHSRQWTLQIQQFGGASPAPH